MSDANSFDRCIRASRLRIRMRSPFFATLSLFARIQASDRYPTAATDGKTIFVNDAYIEQVNSAELDALLVHAILHAALQHPARRGVRDELIWNIAADIVVNGILEADGGFAYPPDTARDPSLAQYSVDEVYELLRFSPDKQPPLPGLDLINNVVAGEAGERESSGGQEDSQLSSSKRAAQENYWRNALQQAQLMAETTMQGGLPDGMARALVHIQAGQIDWRTHLWRYLVQTPHDFQNFDRRFVGRGLYLEALAGESVRVYVAVDTSGSVHDEQIRTLVSEVQGILASYPHLICELYYADDKLYGPYTLSARSAIPPPMGGGGTDFQPFFNAVEARHNPHESALCVYLTDGCGLFPRRAPIVPTLWVLAPGGAAASDIPFGEVTRLLTHSHDG
jgi:predicted metal-dependent peptidase